MLNPFPTSAGNLEAQQVILTLGFYSKSDIPDKSNPDDSAEKVAPLKTLESPLPADR
jgi:hypothetical protein